MRAHPSGILAIIGSVAVLCFAAIGCDYGMQQTAGRAYEEPVFAGTAGEFIQLVGSSADAGSRFDNRVVRVTGKVELKTVDEASVPALLLSTGELTRSQRREPAKRVECVFHDRFKRQATRVKLGDVVTVQGVVAAGSGGLLLRECLFPIERVKTTIERYARYPLTD